MSRNRMEECDGACGEEPEYGAIFMSSSSTRKECLRRKLFGLPSRQANFVKQVKAGMILFLFDFESRELHGVFQARSDGAINIDPNAFCSSGRQYPAQVKFYEKWRCRPLRESEFCHAISENYYTGQKFNFGLSKEQVKKLLSLFSMKKVESSRVRKAAVENPTRQREITNLRNTVGDRGLEDRRAGETNGDVQRESPVRVTSARDPFGHRSTTNYGLGDVTDTDQQDFYTTKGNEYSGDTFGVCRRLADPKMHHGLKDSVRDDCNMSDSYGKNAYSDYSLTDDRRVPKNSRHTANGWSENEYHEKDGIAQERPWSNHKSRLHFESDLVVPPQSSVPLGSPYATNREYYDPCDPGIMGGPMMKNSRHAPNVDAMGSGSFTANSNIPGGGYFRATLPSETVKVFADEYNGKSMDKTSSVDMDILYIPMPTEHRQYQVNTGQLHHSQFPGLPSAEASENMRSFERPSYSRDSIFPSFVYPLSGRDLSPNDGVYQHQEGHVSYPKDPLVGDSRIYPSFTYPSTAEDRVENRVRTYQRHEESGFDDAFDSNNKRVSGMKDEVNPAEVERKSSRKSVFSRLALPSKKRDAEKDTCRETESVEEVMDFLNDCQKHWREQKRSNVRSPDGFGKSKKKKEKIHTREVHDDSDLMLPCTETTTPDDLFDSEKSMEHGGSAQKRPFIDFKRRSKVQKSLGNPTQGCNDSSVERSAPQEKKRKLLRPKLIEDDSEKERVNNDRSNENLLASQSASEVLVRDLHGRGDQLATQIKVGNIHGLSV